MHGTFDALVVLGRAIMGTHIPAPPEDGGAEPTWKSGMLQRDEFEDTSYLVDGYNYQPRRTPWRRYRFDWDDVPEAVLAADEAAGTTFPVEAARALAARNGPNAQAAAAVRVPSCSVSASGTSCGSARRGPRVRVSHRPAAHRGATVRPLHNLASSRHWLWDRMIRWANSVLQ